MSNQLLALKIVLNELGVGTDISDVNLRKEKQKAIYLAQSYGIDMGYSFGWYVKGPYSPKLTQDYYDLSNQDIAIDQTLRADISEKLRAIKSRLIESESKPEQLTIPDWLELLASWHFLTTVSKYESETAKAKLLQQKPHVAPYADIAARVLAA